MSDFTITNATNTAAGNVTATAVPLGGAESSLNISTHRALQISNMYHRLHSSFAGSDDDDDDEYNSSSSTGGGGGGSSKATKGTLSPLSRGAVSPLAAHTSDEALSPVARAKYVCIKACRCLPLHLSLSYTPSLTHY